MCIYTYLYTIYMYIYVNVYYAYIPYNFLTISQKQQLSLYAVTAAYKILHCTLLYIIYEA